MAVTQVVSLSFPASRNKSFTPSARAATSISLICGFRRGIPGVAEETHDRGTWDCSNSSRFAPSELIKTVERPNHHGRDRRDDPGALRT